MPRGDLASHTVLALVEREYGSVDEFFVGLLQRAPEALDESLPLPKRADAAGLSLPIFARLLATPQFRMLVRAEMVNTIYGFTAERRHFEEMARVATGERRLVSTSKGDLVEVDQTPTDVIAAGRYLNEARGTPIEARQGPAGGIHLHIGSPDASVEVEGGEGSIHVRVDSGERDAPTHLPRVAGDLPPSRVQARSSAPAGQLPAESQRSDAAFGSLYGADAIEADEEHRVTEKSLREKPLEKDGGVGDARRPTNTSPDSFIERARRWADLPFRAAERSRAQRDD